MSYAKKVDVNHQEIVRNLRAVPGVYVQDVSSCPGLGADLIVRYQERAPMLLEIKAGPKSPLTESEKKARKYFSPYWARVESFEDALEAIGIPQGGPPIPENW